MNIPTKKPPKVLPIQQLPDFVKSSVATIWQKYGNPKDTSGLVFTYFDAIYTKDPMPQDLFIHECVHYVRQGAGENEELAKEWWDRYVNETKFRLDEELLAYREQYKFIFNKSNRQISFEHAKRLALDLSSPIYGRMITFNEALSAIMKK